jgi:hypothetical protein
MITAWRNVVAKAQRLFRLIVLFCVLRFAVGIGAIVLFDRDAIAWGPELTVIVVGALAVYLLVALAVRQADRHPSSGR